MTAKTKYTIEFGGLDRRGAEYSNSISVEDVSEYDGLVRFIKSIFAGEYSTVHILAIQQDIEAVIECPICGEPLPDCKCTAQDRLKFTPLHQGTYDGECLVCGEPRDSCDCVWRALSVIRVTRYATNEGENDMPRLDNSDVDTLEWVAEISDEIPARHLAQMAWRPWPPWRTRRQVRFRETTHQQRRLLMETKQTMSLWKSDYDGDPWMVWDPSLVLTPEESLTLFWETYPTVRRELAPAFGNDVDIQLCHAPSACEAWPPSWDDYSDWTKRRKAATKGEPNLQRAARHL